MRLAWVGFAAAVGAACTSFGSSSPGTTPAPADAGGPALGDASEPTSGDGVDASDGCTLLFGPTTNAADFPVKSTSSVDIGPATQFADGSTPADAGTFLMGQLQGQTDVATSDYIERQIPVSASHLVVEYDFAWEDADPYVEFGCMLEFETPGIDEAGRIVLRHAMNEQGQAVPVDALATYSAKKDAATSQTSTLSAGTLDRLVFRHVREDAVRVGNVVTFSMAYDGGPSTAAAPITFVTTPTQLNVMCGVYYQPTGNTAITRVAFKNVIAKTCP